MPLSEARLPLGRLHGPAKGRKLGESDPYTSRVGPSASTGYGLRPR
jgi:hypothetical protein